MVTAGASPAIAGDAGPEGWSTAGQSTSEPAAGAHGADGPASGTESLGRSARPARRRQPPRHVVRRAACPRCHAAAGEPCQGRRGPRVSHHIERVEVVWEQRPTEASPAPGSQPDGASGGPVKRSDPAGVDRDEHAPDCSETVAGALAHRAA